MTSGYGSAHVNAPFVITPLESITQWLGSGRVSYSSGAPIAATTVTPATQHVIKMASLPWSAPTPETKTADAPGTGSDWQAWTGTIKPLETGSYEFSAQSGGDVWVTLNGQPLISQPGTTDNLETWTTTVQL